MNQQKIGKFIATKRKEKNLTQEELAEKLGVTNKSISKWENGNCLPDSSLYKPLCNILEITLDELFNGEQLSKKTKFKLNEGNILLILLCILTPIIVFLITNVQDVSYKTIIEDIIKTDTIVVKVQDPNKEEFKLIKRKLLTDKTRIKEIINIIYNSNLYEGPVNLPSSKYFLELLNEKGKLITKIEINPSNGHFFMNNDGYSYTLAPTKEQMTEILFLIEQ